LRAVFLYVLRFYAPCLSLRTLLRS